MKTHHSFLCPSVSEALPIVLSSVMMDGEEVGTRQGERAKEILMPRIALQQPWQREVLVPGRKASLAAQIAETMWVLAGRNDVKWLSHYLPRAADFSDDGTTWTGGYGPRIRGWKGFQSVNIDQLTHVVELLKTDRGTRRAVINIYDPEIDWSGGKDVPCNNWLSFISRSGKLHMNVATRSNDVIWGWSGINQFEWSALQEIVAHLTGNQIGTLTFNVTSLHVYEKHWDKAARIVDSSGTTTYDHLKASPRFALEDGYRDLNRVDELISRWFELETLIRKGTMVEHAVDTFPEPMMQSWLRVIQWYWSRDSKYLEPIKGTRLCVAAMMSPKRKPTAAEQAVLNNPHVSEAIKATITTVEPDGTVTGEVTEEANPGLYEMLALGANGEYSMSVRETQPDGTVVETPIEVSSILKPMTPAQIAAGPLFDNSARPVTVDDIDALQDKVLKAPVISTRGAHRPLAWTAQFVEFVDNLHREKSAVYGDSWKRRGEQMAILANIARKVDRLGEGGAGDTAADTVVDLLVYLAKYALWLNEKGSVRNSYAPEAEDDQVRAILDVEDQRCVKVVQHASIPPRIVALKEYFEQLTIVVQAHEIENALQARMKIVDAMITQAFPVARYFWGVENGHILNPYQASELFTAPVTNETRRWAGYESDGENID